MNPSTTSAASARAIAGVCLLAAMRAGAAEQAEPARTLGRISVMSDLEEEFRSPFRTGGDVDVVTRAEIESAHYTNITEAIRRIPGVQVSGPGYRANEYGFTFGDEISINGDTSVIIMVDGRRIDNDANSYGPSGGSSAASKSRVPLDVITNIYNVERIEIVKGTGAAAYGADATGGVINIVTRKGSVDHEMVTNAAFGSWGKENYALSQSGAFSDGSLRYFASFNYQTSDDTKYRDAYLDRTVTYVNTGYRDYGASLNLSKSFNDDHELLLQYSWTDNKARYPITAPDYATIDLLYGDQLQTSSSSPGYRNWFLYDAWLGSYTGNRSSDVSLKYVFDKADGMESHVNAYRNYRRYTSRDYGGLWGTQYGDITPADIQNALQAAGNEKQETVDGIELQLARKLGRHTVMTGWAYRDSEYEAISLSSGLRSLVNRDAVTGYLQDKVEVTDRWTVTPGVRYSKYGEIERKSTANVVTTRGDADKVTFAAYSNYETDRLGDVYVSWAQIFRPKTNNDFNAQVAQEPLFDEEGASWTLGLRKRFGESTAVDINYAMTDMSNTLKRYSVWDPTVVNTGSPTGFGNFVNRYVNATSEGEAFNVGIDHRFNDNFAAKASYAYVMETFRAKNYARNPNDATNVNALINRFRPLNQYRADLLYTAGRWDANLYAELSTGMSTRYFTDDRFLVINASINYDLFAKTRVYVTGDNLTNEAWENKAHPVYGPGSFPQPARSYSIGVEQRF